MKTILGVAGSTALVFLLAACAGTAPAAVPSPAVTPAASAPTAIPTPTAMSLDSAGKLYLTEVCKLNAKVDELNAVAEATPLNLPAAKQKSAEARDVTKAVIESFSRPDVVWPDAVKSDIIALTDVFYGEVTAGETLSTQTTESGFWATWNSAYSPANVKASGIPAQKVRLKLGLPADTSGSCAAAK